MISSENEFSSTDQKTGFKQAWWDGETDFATWQKKTGLDKDSSWTQIPQQ
jgi:hypothetical protein